MIKVVITGVESTGKTTLASELAKNFAVPFVSEYSRQYLDNLDRPYTRDDLLDIAKGQLREEAKIRKRAPGLLICDTALYVIKIWSEYKYGTCHPWILNQLKDYSCDLFILPFYDVPFEKDPLRENPHSRKELFGLFHDALIRDKRNYVIVKGSQKERLNQMINHLNPLITEYS